MNIKKLFGITNSQRKNNWERHERQKRIFPAKPQNARCMCYIIEQLCQLREVRIIMENYLAYVIRRVWKHLPLILRWYRWMQWKKPFRWMSSKLTRSSKSILKHIYFSNSLSYGKCEIKSIKINWHATNGRICRSRYNSLQVKRLVWPPQDRFHQCSIPGPPVDHNQ